jgi:magnesium-protoporphyrin O-methyltransferase
MTVQSAGAELDQRKANLREYFGPLGFERWRTIYGDGPVSFIRRTVREGHAAMVALALEWAEQSQPGQVLRVLDAGCGPGMVSMALAQAGHQVTGCDLSEQMVSYAQEQAATAPTEIRSRLHFLASDLETVAKKLEGQKFDLIMCLDVLIYYPEAELGRIIQSLTALQDSSRPRRIIFTYAPASLPLRLMHRLGRMFPHKQRATSLEIIGMKAVIRALDQANFKLHRQRHFNKGFYHVVLAEAVSK